jgi:hypothetical protein
VLASERIELTAGLREESLAIDYTELNRIAGPVQGCAFVKLDLNPWRTDLERNRQHALDLRPFKKAVASAIAEPDAFGSYIRGEPAIRARQKRPEDGSEGENCECKHRARHEWTRRKDEDDGSDDSGSDKNPGA